jgi:hypothetical protein
MLHLHNGDSVANTARLVGVPGRHVAYRETLISGPVRPNLGVQEWIEERARFLAEHYGENLLRVRNELLEQEQTLDRAREEEEVVLWFEHDLFCLANLLYLLSRLTKCRRLSLIWCSHPLGTMEDEDIFKQFHSRYAVAPAMMNAAALAWRAYISEEATDLNRLLDADFVDFPFLREGFLLHASRFPSLRNGLGEVEHRALEGIEAGATEFASLFLRFDQSPPRFGFGDGEFLRHLRRLATCAVPMITITEAENETPPKALFALTPAGKNVLDAKVDFIELNNAGFWLGGAHLTRARLWRWDGDARRIVSQPAAS